MADFKQNKSIYPDAHSGPLGEKHANYAQPKQWAGKRDKDVPFKVIVFVGILVAIGLFYLIMLSTKAWK